MNKYLLKNPKKRFTASYVIALSIIALLSIASQIVIRSVLNKQEKDARVINISGRQRMLSQKISKLALQLDRAEDQTEFNTIKKEFATIVDLWSSSHYGLRDRLPEMELQGDNSATIQKMFEGIAQNFDQMYEASQSILLAEEAYLIDSFVSQILRNEGSFLKQMNTITFQYDHESTARIQHVKLIEMILLGITLLSIFLEAFFIFRPAVSAVDKYLRETINRGLELREAHDNLLASEEKKESVERELYEQLEKNHELQVNINKDLELKINERTREIQDKNEEILAQSNELKSQNDLLASANQKVTDSITYATKLQYSILGYRQDILENFKDGFILNKPKDIISGDFYWYYQTEELRFLIVGDCTGHGVSAAFMTIIGNLLLNDVIVNQQIKSPNDILNLLDMELYSLMNLRNTQKVYDGMDLGIVVINQDQRIIEFCGAKRPVYFVGKDNKINKIAGSKSTIGYSSKNVKKNFETETINYQTGDRLYLSSDGFQDQFGGNSNSKFMQNRLIESLNRTMSYPMEKQKKVLEGVFDKWKGNNAQTDDVLIVGVEL
ncbi:SpoIIE family protein phosphatase [Flammeovirga sp. EKP202]|uniref:SpoIIE family protein phosphatase n=1 Tax=Flammeovirga sp. EKP202 TaxID=2770592 RepID=UPI00165FC651|nr:SpoIIE family protein phosphatase [Flammeovirga sp. EKP202]MBD0403269.1 type IV pili methyl-accepting chemotaxis transducer N-terminal domain-containing protein [Flammeovirga sp. EKP202]